MIEEEGEITSKEFWLDYWKQKMDRGEINHIGRSYLFSDVLLRNAGLAPDNTVIEIGGFPGIFALFLKREAQMEPAIFDYVIHRDFLKAFLAKNGFAENDLEIQQGNIQDFVPTKQFGMVFSVGLVEHFDDTADIIRKHLPFCQAGGRLVILLPNYTGINGWMNKTFDRPSYDVHNIQSMNIDRLRSIGTQLGLQDVSVYYHGKFSLWLENYDRVSLATKFLLKTIWFWGKLFTRVVPMESRALSPYIVLEARKP